MRSLVGAAPRRRSQGPRNSDLAPTTRREPEHLIEAGSTTANTSTVPLETLARRLACTRKTGRPERPFFIELAGTPRAGKTTAVTALARALMATGLRVATVTERAAECPISDKRHPFFNIWTSCSTLTEVLEAQDRSADFVLIDRGLFDAACWMDWYRKMGHLNAAEHRAIERFLLLPLWAKAIDLVLVMTAQPPVAMEREFAAKAAQGPSQIMNDSTLRAFNSSVHPLRARLRRDFSLVHVDTSRATPDEVLRCLLEAALARFLERSPAESVLVVPREEVADLPSEPGFVPAGEVVTRFLAAVHQHGRFVDRRIAEAEPQLIQPIPVAYLQYRDRLLVVPRHGSNGPNGQATTRAVWVGGHVRDTDGEDRDPIGVGLLRELEEEVHLSGLPPPPLVGLVLDGQGDQPRTHVGLVHRVRLDGSVVRTLPGELVDVQSMASYFESLEPWSRRIVADHLRLVAAPVPV